MKYFILGILFTFLSLDITNSVIDNYQFSTYDKTKTWAENSKEFKKKYPLMYKTSIWLISPSMGLYFPLTKRCLPPSFKKYKGRKYFDCNFIQNFISDIIYGVKP